MESLLGAAMLCGFHPPDPGRSAEPLWRMGTPLENLEERDPIGTPNSLASEHFVVRWGDDGELPEGFDQLLLDDLEASWAYQIDTAGWERPVGTDVYKMNVYVGNTFEGGRTISFSGGYTWLQDGVPEIVLSPDSLQTYRGSGRARIRLVSHEFNHALQIGRPGLYEDQDAAFYYEATANWMAAQQTEDVEEFAEWGAFLLHPRFAIDTFEDFSAQSPRAGRQYQAAMFVQHVSDHYGVDLVRQSWDEATGSVLPLDWIDQATEEPFRDIFVDFAVTHATGDHIHASAYASGASQGAFFGGAEAITAWIPEEGGAGTPGGTEIPERYAWNHLVYDALEGGTLRFGFVAAERGSQGTPSDFETVAVIERAGEYEQVPFQGEVELEVQGGDFVHFVVVSVPPTADYRERFGYSWSLGVEPVAGCGCTTSGNPFTRAFRWLA
ncbi:MAG: hypothetical protein KC656_20850, partial [Myxococcales bacterium]|nr:hypothetical protein [Myxococcales bacterium]